MAILDRTTKAPARGLNWVQAHPILLCLIVWFGVANRSAAADPDDEYRTFEKSFNDSSVAVNKLHFPDQIYKIDEATARRYFARYFEKHYLTEALRINLAYPLYSWGDNHKVLQQAALSVLAQKMDGLFQEHAGADALEAVFVKEPRLHDHVFQTFSQFQFTAMHSKVVTKEQAKTTYGELLKLLDASCLCGAKLTRLDPDKYIYVSAVLSQFLGATFEYARLNDDLPGLAAALKLDPVRRRLLEKRSALIADNMGFDADQLAAISDFLDAVPEPARFPLVIRCHDLIVSKRNKRVNVHMFGSGVNVFNAKVGKANGGTPFPPEWKKDGIESDMFTIVVAHEYAHGLDVQIPKRSANLQLFRETLHKRAGKDRNNYLRSTIEDDFFVKTPQEFVASIANQYCTSTGDTFGYALQMYDKGNVNQINQFVMFASIFSDDKEVTFMNIDRAGRIMASKHSITKQDGVITSLRHEKTRYIFNFKDGVIDRVERRPIGEGK